MIDPKEIADFLTVRFGLATSAESNETPEGQLLIIRPDGVEHTIGFTIEFVVGWRSVQAKFLPGRFAAGLIKAMEASSREQRSAFGTFSNSILNEGADLTFLINGESVDVGNSEIWPMSWESAELKMRKGALLLEPDQPETSRLVRLWVARFFGASLSLLPLEKVDEAEKYQVAGVKEGKVKYEVVKRYERSRINRAACIEIQGVSCKVCGMTFGEVFGEIGDGFIHVHHLEPVSMMDGEYVIDPAVDLVPVCPNCHAMLHKRTPPYSVDEMRLIFCNNQN